MPTPIDPDAPDVGGPSDPDIAPIPPDPGALVVLLHDPAYQPHDGHLIIRGQGRWLYVNERLAWALTAEQRVKIDADTVAKLRGSDVWVDGRQLVIGAERFELVPREGPIKGDVWATLEPALSPTSESA